MQDISRQPRFSRPALVIMAVITGFTSLLFQTYCLHLVFLALPQASSYAALAISAFLGGMGASALLLPKWGRGDPLRSFRILCILNTALVFYAACFLADQRLIQSWLDGSLAPLGESHVSITVFGAVAMIAAVPAFCLGGAFPLLNGCFIRDLPQASADTGSLYFWDILGCVAGGLLTGFVLIPYAGLSLTLLTAIGGTCVMAWVFARACWQPVKADAAGILLLLTGILLALAAENGGLLPQDAKISTASRTIFEKPSHYGTIRVTHEQGVDSLFVNQRQMCADHRGPRTEKLISTDTLLHVPKGGRIMNIGLGCGVTAHRLTERGDVKLDIVEINPVIREAYEAVFDRQYKLLSNNNVSLHIDDGARVLRSGKLADKPLPRYDAVVIDIEEVNIIYSSPLYTREYFEHAKSRMTPDGVFAIWTFYISDDYMKVLYNTLSAVFGHVAVGMAPNDANSAYFIASDRPVTLSTIGSRPVPPSMMASGIKDINTVASPVIHRYFSLQSAFGLAEDYHEDTMVPETR